MPGAEGDDVTPPTCPTCGSEMESGAIHGSPWLTWARTGAKPGRFGTLIGADRMAKPSMTAPAKIPAIRCAACRTGRFSY